MKGQKPISKPKLIPRNKSNPSSKSYKDPTGGREVIGTPPNSGYDEKQPNKR